MCWKFGFVLDLRLHYVEFEVPSRFHVRVDLSLCLFEFEDQLCDFILQRAYLVSSQYPFGRITYMFQYKNAPFLRQLQSEITAVNAGALELDTLPQHVIEAALSTYKNFQGNY